MFSSCYCLSSSRSTSGWVASAPLEPPCVRFPRLSRASSTHGVARPPSREEAREEDRLNHGRPSISRGHRLAGLGCVSWNRGVGGLLVHPCISGILPPLGGSKPELSAK